MEDRKSRQENKLSQAANNISKNTTSSAKKTIRRRDQNYVPTLSPSLSVAFSTSLCHDGYAKAATTLVTYVPKVTLSAIKIACIFMLILCCINCVSVVTASSSDIRDLGTSDGVGGVIDNVPHRVKGNGVAE